jgi:predicted ester cyclase
MSANLDALRGWLDSINRGDLEAIETYVTDDIVDHHLPPELPAGRAGVQLWCGLLREALQLRLSIEDVIEQGDRIAVRATMSGCHVADFMGLPATNRMFTSSIMTIERFVEGRIAERWEMVDTAAVMEQLTG